MYTRNFYKEDGGIFVPENYDGIALREEREAAKDTPDKDKCAGACEEKRESESVFSPLKYGGIKLPFDIGNLFSGFTLGLEEILIIGLAAFLFFNSDGDKECAIMLLLLLFVK